MNISTVPSTLPPLPLPSILSTAGTQRTATESQLPSAISRQSQLRTSIQQTSSNRKDISLPTITVPSFFTPQNQSSKESLKERKIALASRRTLTERPSEKSSESLKTPRNTEDVIRAFGLNNVLLPPPNKLQPIRNKGDILAQPGGIRARRSREENIDPSTPSFSPLSSFSSDSTRSMTPPGSLEDLS